MYLFLYYIKLLILFLNFLDFFTFKFQKIDVEVEEQAKQLKGEVKKMLIISNRNPFKILNLVDSIQRLNVSYHFENEIDQILEQIYANYREFTNIDGNDDLYTISLLFRLLRQQGYKIPCGKFIHFLTLMLSYHLMF